MLQTFAATQEELMYFITHDAFVKKNYSCAGGQESNIFSCAEGIDERDSVYKVLSCDPNRTKRDIWDFYIV